MVTVKACVVTVQEKYFLEVTLEQESVSIPISDDNPNRVKSAFNKLLERTRAGPFAIELTSDTDDLFTHVATEYIAQLNRELQEVWKEIEQHKLVSGDGN